MPENPTRPGIPGVLRGLKPAGTLVCFVALAGCGKLNALLGRGGTSLTATFKAGQDFTFRSLVEAVAPTGGGGTISTRIDLKLHARVATVEGDGWAVVDAEVTDGRYDVDGKPRATPLAGQKLSFKYGELRKLSRWQGLAFPAGLELLELGPPKGRVKAREQWKLETRRVLVQQQEEIGLDKFFTYDGPARIANEDAEHLAVSIPTTKKTLSTGAQLEFSGSGEAWVSKKDGRILKVTEVIEGQIRDEKVAKEPGRFAQAITLMDAALAPGEMASLTERAAVPTAPKPAPAPSPPTAAPAPAATPAAAAPPAPVTPPAAPAASPKPATAGTGVTNAVDRLVFVSNATGKREVWSVSVDGTAKRCLTGFVHEHWSPAIDSEGKALACVSRRARGINVWLINLVGGDQAALTQFGEAEEISTAWSDGGQRLVFLRGGKLWSVHRDGFNLQTYAISGRAVAFTAAPGGTHVAVVINELNQNKIVTVDAVSGAVRELFEGDLPAWSPDSARLAYRSVDSVVVANADGSVPHQLAKGAIVDAPLIWDPQGRRIVCTKMEGGAEDVYLVDASPGGKLVRVTSRGGTAWAVSPGGDRVAYLLHGDLWVATTDGNVHSRLTADGTTTPPIWWGKHVGP